MQWFIDNTTVHNDHYSSQCSPFSVFPWIIMNSLRAHLLRGKSGFLLKKCQFAPVKPILIRFFDSPKEGTFLWNIPLFGEIVSRKQRLFSLYPTAPFEIQRIPTYSSNPLDFRHSAGKNRGLLERSPQQNCIFFQPNDKTLFQYGYKNCRLRLLLQKQSNHHIR